MSVRTYTTVWCDGDDGNCGEFVEGKRATDVRREARRQGWYVGRPGGMDWCREHRQGRL